MTEIHQLFQPLAVSNVMSFTDHQNDTFHSTSYILDEVFRNQNQRFPISLSNPPIWVEEDVTICIFSTVNVVSLCGALVMSVSSI